MARKLRSRGFQRRPGRTSWAFLAPTSTSIETSTAVLIAQSNAALDAKRPFTVLRTHILVSIATNQLIADESQFGAFGVCVVTDQASAIGVTVIPTPITDIGSDSWFAHQLVAAALLFGDATGFASPGRANFFLDSKAMRKVNDDQDVVMVAETAAISSGINFQIAGRILIKEN